MCCGVVCMPMEAMLLWKPLFPPLPLYLLCTTWACSEKLVDSGQWWPLVRQLRVIWIIIRIRNINKNLVSCPY